MPYPIRNGSASDCRRRLRTLMTGPDILVLPGPYDAISAILLNQLGFEGLFAGGNVGSASSIGVADLGLMTMSEQLTFCRSIVEATGAIVVADGDDGYGGFLQAARTVQAFERAGVAAIILEDQAAPKHCPFYDSLPPQLVTKNIMLGKLKAALDARQDEMMIWARTDALVAGRGVEETLDRICAYVDAGADAIFVPCANLEDLTSYAKRWDRPQPLVVSGYGFPSMTLHEAKALGFAVKLDPAVAILTALKAVEEVMLEYRATGSLAHAAARSKTARELDELAGSGAAAEMERRYLGAPDGTPGNQLDRSSAG